MCIDTSYLHITVCSLIVLKYLADLELIISIAVVDDTLRGNSKGPQFSNYQHGGTPLYTYKLES